MVDMINIKPIEFRKMFGQARPAPEMPNLIAVQKQSYDQFLQINVAPDQREESGLHAVFNSVFPIKDFAGRAELGFISYELETPKYDIEECRHRGMTYQTAIKCKLQLSVFDVDEETGTRSIKDIKEQDVLYGRHSAHDR